MPKLKTKKALLKRIKISKNKKIICSKAGRRHLLSSKSKNRKRHLRRRNIMSATVKKMIKRSLPYSL